MWERGRECVGERERVKENVGELGRERVLE